VTLVIAMKWLLSGGEAVVISSDSRVTTPFVMYEIKKIYPIIIQKNNKSLNLAVAAGAGDLSLVKYGYEVAEKIIKNHSSKKGKEILSSKEFKEAIKEIELNLIHRFRFLRDQGLEISFQMIIASVDKKGKASIYLFDNRGLAQPVHENPGYAIIGSGFVTGGTLLLRLFEYTPEKSKNLDLGMLSTFIIDIVSEVDPAVGPFIGESWLIRKEGNQIVGGPLKEEALREYKEKVRERKEIMRFLHLLCDKLGEDKVKELIKKIAK